MLQDHHLIESRTRIRKCRRLVVVPIGKFTIKDALEINQKNPSPKNPPIQLLGPFHDLLLIPHIRIRRRFLLALIRKIRRLHLHRPQWPRLPYPKVRLIQHLYCQVHRFRPKVHYERFTFEVSGLVHVHFNPWSPAVNLFGDNAAFAKNVANLVERCIEGDGSDIYGGVDALSLLLLPVFLLVN